MFFRQTLQLDKFEGADFKYDNSFFKILAQKYPHETFLVLILGILIISRNLQLDKFEGADLKYKNVIFKFLPKNTQMRLFWSQF